MKRICSLLLAALLLAGTLPFAAFAAVDTPFSDVDPEAWYAWCVNDVDERGLMNGTGGGTFTPDGDLTRAMLVTVLWRLAGASAPREPAPFDDVPAGTWYSDAVAWASGFRVVEGYGGRTFGPNDPVTREQMAVIFYRWAQGQSYDVSFGSNDALLTEEGSVTGMVRGEDGSPSAANAGLAVSDWAADAVLWAAEHDFLVRREVRGLSPLSGSAWYLCAPETAARAEVAVFLSRFCRVYIDGGDTATVLFCPDEDFTELGGYCWDFMSMELPETWQGAYSVMKVGYDGVPDAFGLTFEDLSNHRSRTSGGMLFDLTLWPSGVDSGWFGGWEKLGDAAPGKSGRLCTVQAPMGRLDLYVTWAADRFSEEDPPLGRLYYPDNPKNYLKMQSQIEGILQSIRFDEGVTVLDTAAGYSFGKS